MTNQIMTANLTEDLEILIIEMAAETVAKRLDGASNLVFNVDKSTMAGPAREVMLFVGALADLGCTDVTSVQ